MPIRFSGSARPRKLKSPDPINMPSVRENIITRVKEEVDFYKANGTLPSVYDGPYIAQTANLIVNNKFAWPADPDPASTTNDTADNWTNTSGLYRVHTYTGADNTRHSITNGETLYYARGSSTAYAYIDQYIDLAAIGANTALIDEGVVTMTFACFFGRDYADSDAARMRVFVLDASDTELASYSLGYLSVAQWSLRESLDQVIPATARKIRVLLEFDRNAGTGSNGNILAPYVELNVINNGTNISAFETHGYSLLS